MVFCCSTRKGQKKIIKNIQLIQKKSGKDETENKEQMVQIENKQQDERFIPNNINNHIKCEFSLYDFYVIT